MWVYSEQFFGPSGVSTITFLLDEKWFNAPSDFDGRTLLPKSLAPKEEIDLDLMVKTRKIQGYHILN